MEVYPELLTEMAITIVKAFFHNEGKKDLSTLVAENVARFARIHKGKALTDTHVRTLCQMVNRAVHKNAFKKHRLVRFKLASLAKVRLGGRARKEAKGPPLTLPELRRVGPVSHTSKAKKAKRKPKIPLRDKLPGHRHLKKTAAAEVLSESLGDLTGTVNAALRKLPPEELMGLAVVLDRGHGSTVLTRVMQGALEKTADIDFDKVAQYTGMTPSAEHPVVASMTSFLTAVAAYTDASAKLEGAWVK